MKRSTALPRLLAWCAWGLMVMSAAQASDDTMAKGDIAYVSGGIGQSERDALLGAKSQYSFWLTTAAVRSGAFLSGVHVKITDRRRAKTVLELDMEGPWLFAALPPGQYEVEASYREAGGGTEQKTRKTTSMVAGELRQMVVYFKNRDEAAMRQANEAVK